MRKVQCVALVGVLLLAAPCLADLRFEPDDLRRIQAASQPGFWEGLFASLAAIIAGVRRKLRTRTGTILLLMLAITGFMAVWNWRSRSLATPTVEAAVPGASFPRASGGP